MHFLHAVERMAFDVYTIYIRQWHPSDRHPPMMSVKKICVHTKYKTPSLQRLQFKNHIN